MEIVRDVKILRPYLLELVFSDGSRREIDLEKELYGEIFEPLKDPSFFSQARVDKDLGTVVWPNGPTLALSSYIIRPGFKRGIVVT